MSKFLVVASLMSAILSGVSGLASDTVLDPRNGDGSAKEVTSLKGFKLGVSFGELRTGTQFEIGAVSPSFLNYGPHDRQNVAVFLDLGTIDSPNTYINGTGNLGTAHSLTGTIGLRGTTDFFPRAQTYGKIGANLIGWDTKLSNRDGTSSSWGALIGIGADFLLGTLDTHCVANYSIFVEAEYRFNHRTADNFTGSPDLFNGTGMNFGVRFHY